MRAISFEIDETAEIICAYCGKKEQFKKAIKNDWRVMVFNDKHKCKQCRDEGKPFTLAKAKELDEYAKNGFQD